MRRTWTDWSGLAWIWGAVFALGAGGLAYWGQGWSPAELITAAVAYLVGWGVLGRRALQRVFGPVFLYEVIRLGRQRRTRRIRLAYALLLAGLFVYWYLLWAESIRYKSGGRDLVRAGELADFANQFFYIYVGVQYLALVLLTPVYVAGCVADEKERKTLEFLLATDLAGYEIVFGKGLARVLALLMYILAGMPVLGILQLFGGIDPELLLANTALAVVTVLGLAALSLWFSVRQKRPREAIMLTYLVLLGYGAVSLASLVYVGQILPRTPMEPIELFGFTITHAELIEHLMPVVEWGAGGNLLATVISAAPRLAGGAVTTVIVEAMTRYVVFWGSLAAFLMILAVARLRPIALRQMHGGARRLTTREARRRPPVGPDALAWREVFVEGAFKSWAAVVMYAIMIGVVFAIPVVMFLMCFGDQLPLVGHNFTRQSEPQVKRIRDFREGINGWVRGVSAVMGFLILMGLAIRGAGAVSAERDQDTWISLISAPISAWQLAWAKWLGTVLSARRGYGMLVAVWALGLVCGAVQPVMLIPFAVTLAIYAAAFAWLGIFCSLSARTTLIATVRAVLAGLFFVGGFWIVLGLLCVLPMSLLFSSDVVLRDTFEAVAYILQGATPPLVLCVLPMEQFTAPELGPFNARFASWAPLAPGVGVFLWLGFTWWLGHQSWRGVCRLTNRQE